MGGEWIDGIKWWGWLKISCQKHNLEPILTDYIYRISYKIAKKGKPCEMDLPLLENDTGPKL